VWVIHSAEARLTEEHAARMAVLEENGKLKQQLAAVMSYADTETNAWKQCQESASQHLTDSIDRLKTKTYLVVTGQPAPQQAGQGMSMPQLPGVAGMVLSLVMQARAQQPRAPAVGQAQVWVLSTSVEPMFAGAAANAWVIHADAHTGQAVDQPHHPFPITQAQQ
jgi:hypothetical protein